MDGVSSIFVTVATVFSGNTGMTVVLIIGYFNEQEFYFNFSFRFAKLMSGAISMGIGDFMASKAGNKKNLFISNFFFYQRT